MATKFVLQILRYRWEDEYLSAWNIYNLLQELLVQQGKWNWKHAKILTAKQKVLANHLLSNKPLLVTRVCGHNELQHMAVDYINEDETLISLMSNYPIVVSSKTFTSHLVRFTIKKKTIEIGYLIPSDKIMTHRQNVD